MSNYALKMMRIAIVDDSPMILAIGKRILEEAGYGRVDTHSDPVAAAATILADPPDLVLLDIHMPGLDGIEMLEQLRPLTEEPTALPVIMLTADGSIERRRRALELGARDFVTKPFDEIELSLRVRNQLRARHLQLELERRNLGLFAEVRARTAELEAARLEMLHRLALAIEYRDDDTGHHAMRLGNSAALVAATMALPGETVDAIRTATPLHDVGKVAIADEILLKRGPLTDGERAIMKRHAIIGGQILANSPSTVLQLGAEIAMTHHERFDGSGYPLGLVGTDIPLPGRIVAVVDVFDALTHDRPYKLAWPVERAIETMLAGRGTHFDPLVLDAFLSLDHAQLLVA